MSTGTAIEFGGSFGTGVARAATPERSKAAECLVWAFLREIGLRGRRPWAETRDAVVTAASREGCLAKEAADLFEALFPRYTDGGQSAGTVPHRTCSMEAFLGGQATQWEREDGEEGVAMYRCYGSEETNSYLYVCTASWCSLQMIASGGAQVFHRNLRTVEELLSADRSMDSGAGSRGQAGVAEKQESAVVGGRKVREPVVERAAWMSDSGYESAVRAARANARALRRQEELNGAADLALHEWVVSLLVLMLALFMSYVIGWVLLRAGMLDWGTVHGAGTAFNSGIGMRGWLAGGASVAALVGLAVMVNGSGRNRAMSAR